DLLDTIHESIATLLQSSAAWSANDDKVATAPALKPIAVPATPSLHPTLAPPSPPSMF
ncbi:hypothetical protein FRC11_012308, partial [Ceratobasidium sp. 423]